MHTKTSIVMIHGLLGSLDFFDPASYLTDYQLIFPKLQGYKGAAQQPISSLQQQVDIVKFAVAQQAQGPVWILGHSVGGAIATLFAEQYPEQVLGFINVEGNFSLQDAFWCQNISQLSAAQWALDYQNMQADPEQFLADSDIQITPEHTRWARAILQHQSASAVQGVAKAVVSATGTKAYQQSIQALIEHKIPHYLIAGEHSAPGWHVPQSVTDSAAASYQIPGTGHMMMLQQPQQFCQLIAEIISADK